MAVISMFYGMSSAYISWIETATSSRICMPEGASK
jgi:membrane-anchored protein YejM (alkaline phosphatase superfamily)